MRAMGWGVDDEKKRVADAYAVLDAMIAACRAEITDELRAADPRRWAAANVRCGDALLEFEERARVTRPTAVARDRNNTSAAGAPYQAALQVVGAMGVDEAAYARSQSGLAMSRLYRFGAQEAVKICTSVDGQMPGDATPVLRTVVQRNLAESLLCLDPQDQKPEHLELAVSKARSANSASREAAWPIRAKVLVTLSRATAALGKAKQDRTLLDKAVEAARAAVGGERREDAPERWSIAQAVLGEALAARAIAVPATVAPEPGVIGRLFLGSDRRDMIDGAGDLDAAIAAFRAALSVAYLHAPDFRSQGRGPLSAALIARAELNGMTPAAMLVALADDVSSEPAAARAQWALDALAVVSALDAKRARDYFAVLDQMRTCATQHDEPALRSAWGTAVWTHHYAFIGNAQYRKQIDAMRAAAEKHADADLLLLWAECARPVYRAKCTDRELADLAQIRVDADVHDIPRLREIWADGATAVHHIFKDKNPARAASARADLKAYAAMRNDPVLWRKWAVAAMDEIDDRLRNSEPDRAVALFEELTPYALVADGDAHARHVGGYFWSTSALKIHPLLLQRDPRLAASVRATMKRVADEGFARGEGAPADDWMRAMNGAIAAVRFKDYAAARALLEEIEREAVGYGNRYSCRKAIEEARNLIRAPEVKAAHGLISEIPKALVFDNDKALTPDRATPDGLRVSRLDASKAPSLTRVGRGLACRELNLMGTSIESLPDDMSVTLRIDVSQCRRLSRLPANLEVPLLVARECTSLEVLPPGLKVSYLDLSGCTSLAALPSDLVVRRGRLSLRGCGRLTGLPRGLGPLAQLDLADCLNIAAIPDDLVVSAWLDIGGSGITARPAHLADVQLRWRGVPIDDRIAFRPHTLDAAEILTEANIELRRVMMERFGLDRFIADANAQVLDADTDAGGPRRLLRIDLPNDEPLVCVSVICPSTQRQFMLRVPPAMRTCRQAIAWTAGFDDPDDYKPRIET
jgi:hypothetical protein